MKKVAISLIFAIFIVMAPAVDAQSWQKRVQIAKGQERAVQGSGTKIKFVEIIEDSRCPTDVNCVWAGNAKIKIEVRVRRGQPRVFELNSALAPKVVSYAGYDFKLVSLAPQLRSNVRINPDKYVVTIEVKKSAR
jgi:hypothetical protein